MAPFTRRVVRAFTRSVSASEAALWAMRSSPQEVISKRDTSYTRLAQFGEGGRRAGVEVVGERISAQFTARGSTRLAQYLDSLDFYRSVRFTPSDLQHRSRSRTIIQFLEREEHSLDEVQMVLYIRENGKAYTVFARALEQLLSERVTAGVAEPAVPADTA